MVGEYPLPSIYKGTKKNRHFQGIYRLYVDENAWNVDILWRFVDEKWVKMPGGLWSMATGTLEAAIPRPSLGHPARQPKN